MDEIKKVLTASEPFQNELEQLKEYQRQLYEKIALNEFIQKAQYLAENFAEVTPLEFYRDMFPVGSLQSLGAAYDGKPTTIAIERKETIIKDKKTGEKRKIINNKRTYITDGLEQLNYLLQSKDMTLIAPVTYYGKKREAQNAVDLYGFVFDVDDVKIPELKNLLFQIENNVLPKPTYIANSGHGLHVYYLLQEPIKLTKNNKRRLQYIKKAMNYEISNPYTSGKAKETKPDSLGIYQAMRAVGSASKFGEEHRIKAYKIGGKVDIMDFFKYVPADDIHFTEKELKAYYEIEQFGFEDKSSRLQEVKELYPEWYERRIVQGLPNVSQPWKVSPNVYNWWLNELRTKAKFGKRYFCIACLACYAAKCGIPYKQLEADAMELLPHFNELNEDNPFTLEDLTDGLQWFKKSYAYKISRNEISKISDIQIKENRRNGRKQAEHLEEARALRDIRQARKGTEWRNKDGRPKGSGTDAPEIIKKWRENNPNGRKADCIKATGLSKPTVYKWWND